MPNYASMTLDEFERALQDFDWYSSMSDDARVYRAGQEAWDELLAFVHAPTTTLAHQALFDDYYIYAYNPDHFPGSKRRFTRADGTALHPVAAPSPRAA
jgi:hypothetical protein